MHDSLWHGLTGVAVSLRSADAIIGMDVTADGSYLLATTAHYLLVIPTNVEGQAKSGFAQSITNKAEAPIKVSEREPHE